MPLILCLESSTDHCLVALAQDGNILCVQESGTPYAHAAQMTRLIEKCLAKSDRTLRNVDALAVSQGPGSYTSLRIGLSIAKGIAYALDKRIVAMSSLQILAKSAAFATGDTAALYCPMIDARRQEVYTGQYTFTGELIKEPEALILQEGVFAAELAAGKPLVFCGNGAAKCQQWVKHPLAHWSVTQAAATAIAALAEEACQRNAFEDIAYLEPFYLKPPNITQPRKVL